MQLLRSILEPLLDLTATNSIESIVDLELNHAVSFESFESLERDIEMMTCLHSSTFTESSFLKSVVKSCFS